MKIIYLHQYFKFPDESGSTRSYDLAISFANEGHEVLIVTSTSNTEYNTKQKWKKIKRDGIFVHYIYLPYSNNQSYLKRSWVFIKFLWNSTFKLLRIRGDLVLVTSTPLTIGIPALVKKWYCKTPFIFEVRDVWPEAVIAIGAIKNVFIKKALYGLENLIYKNAVAIVPLSKDMKKSIVSRYPQYTDKTNVVIENIAEINRFQLNKNKVNLEDFIGFIPRFTVLYAGTFGKVNGIHKIIELAEKTINLDKELVYILMGSGVEKESIISLGKAKGILNKNIFILESISKNELPLWYNAISMGSSFVIDIPELWSNSANKFFDTLAAGKPILINHEGWQAKIIRRFNIGYVIPFEITDQVAEEFVTYSQNSNIVEMQKQNALNLAIEKYSLEAATKKYLKVLGNVYFT